MTHNPKGVTDKDFELARKIEEVVQWRPGAGSALEGTPNEDQRFAYITYDEPASAARDSAEGAAAGHSAAARRAISPRAGS